MTKKHLEDTAVWLGNAPKSPGFWDQKIWGSSLCPRWLERSKAKQTVTATIMDASKIVGLTFDRIIYQKIFQDEAVLGINSGIISNSTVHHRCRDRSNFRKTGIATMSVRMVVGTNLWHCHFTSLAICVCVYVCVCAGVCVCWWRRRPESAACCCHEDECRLIAISPHCQDLSQLLPATCCLSGVIVRLSTSLSQQ